MAAVPTATTADALARVLVSNVAATPKGYTIGGCVVGVCVCNEAKPGTRATDFDSVCPFTSSLPLFPFFFFFFFFLPIGVQVDYVLFRYARRAEPYYVLVPNLVQHVGVVSTSEDKNDKRNLDAWIPSMSAFFDGRGVRMRE